MQTPLTLRRWQRAEYDRLVDLGVFQDGVLQVYRDPEPDASPAFGWRYRSVSPLVPPATVAPLAFGGARIAVADLLP